MKKVGFTLSEVLITVGIIGVLSAITIPALVQKYQEIKTVSQVLEAVSIFSQGFTKIAQECEGLSNCNSNYLMDVLNYTLPPLLNANMNVLQTCRAGEHTACLGDIEYKSLDGKTKTGEFAGRYQMSGILNNGMTFTLGLPNGGWAYIDNWPLNIDINGQSGPNIVGRDAFAFYVSDSGIVRARGMAGAASCDNKNYSGNNRNGYRCSEWILKYHNMDYLRHSYPNWSKAWN